MLQDLIRFNDFLELFCPNSLRIRNAVNVRQLLASDEK